MWDRKATFSDLLYEPTLFSERDEISSESRARPFLIELSPPSQLLEPALVGIQILLSHAYNPPSGPTPCA
jgi:hypothetical protein